MSELEKQKELVDKYERLVKDEVDTLDKLSAKKRELEELIEHQQENLLKKRGELRRHTANLERLQLLGEGKAVDEHSFECENCGKTHEESIYCMAQRAMGHTMTHTCDCGHKTYLEPYKK